MTPKKIRPFTEIEGFNELVEYISHFKDPNRGQASYSAGMTLSEAKQLDWLKD